VNQNVFKFTLDRFECTSLERPSWLPEPHRQLAIRRPESGDLFDLGSSPGGIDLGNRKVQSEEAWIEIEDQQGSTRVSKCRDCFVNFQLKY